jgi:hypothetical protein
MESALFWGITPAPTAANGNLPPTGVIAFYVDSADDHLKYVNDAGTVVDVTDASVAELPDIVVSDGTPKLIFKDSDCTDADDNATIAVTAAATGTGAEDIDVAFSAQAGGADTEFMKYTGSNDALSLGATSASLLGFYGEVGVNKGGALTAAASAITHTAPGTPDAAIQDLVSTAASFGFVTKDEGNTVLRNIVTMDTRIGELETRLQDLGLIN